MALVVETGEGVTGANSYASVSAADDYNSNHPYGESWAPLETARKEQCLQMSTRLLDELVAWYGSPTFNSVDGYVSTSTHVQYLKFPRFGINDAEGYQLDPYKIPRFLINATAEFARVLNGKDRTLEPLTKGYKKLKDPSGAEIEVDKYDQPLVLPRSVIIMIKDYGSTGRSTDISRG